MVFCCFVPFVFASCSFVFCHVHLLFLSLIRRRGHFANIHYSRRLQILLFVRLSAEFPVLKSTVFKRLLSFAVFISFSFCFVFHTFYFFTLDGSASPSLFLVPCSVFPFQLSTFHTRSVRRYFDVLCSGRRAFSGVHRVAFVVYFIFIYSSCIILSLVFPYLFIFHISFPA